MRYLILVILAISGCGDSEPVKEIRRIQSQNSCFLCSKDECVNIENIIYIEDLENKTCFGTDRLTGCMNCKFNDFLDKVRSCDKNSKTTISKPMNFEKME